MRTNRILSSTVMATTAGLLLTVSAQAEHRPINFTSIDPQSLENPAFPLTDNYTRGFAINQAYLLNLQNLREEYLSIRIQQNGALTAEQLADAQRKLDIINTDRNRSLRNIDPYSTMIYLKSGRKE